MDELFGPGCRTHPKLNCLDAVDPSIRFESKLKTDCFNPNICSITISNCDDDGPQAKRKAFSEMINEK